MKNCCFKNCHYNFLAFFSPFADSSSRPSPLKVITLLLIAAAICVTSAAIKDAVLRSKGQ